MLFKIQDIIDICSPETVDGLVVIPHHAEIFVLSRKQPYQLELGGIGILVLIHHDVFKPLPVKLQHLGKFPEEYHGIHDEVVKIHHAV